MERAGIIARLREALADFETWTGELIADRRAPPSAPHDALYPGHLALERAGIIARLREALADFEVWTGQEIPPHIARQLQPGDLADVEDE